MVEGLERLEALGLGREDVKLGVSANGHSAIEGDVLEALALGGVTLDLEVVKKLAGGGVPDCSMGLELGPLVLDDEEGLEPVRLVLDVAYSNVFLKIGGRLGVRLGLGDEVLQDREKEREDVGPESVNSIFLAPGLQSLVELEDGPDVHVSRHVEGY